MKFLILLSMLFCLNAFSAPVKLNFAKFGAQLEVDFTRYPVVLQEGIAHLKLIDGATGRQIAFPKDKNSVSMKLTALDTKVIAPAPEVHLNYIDDMGRIASRIFFTSGGRWKVTFTIVDKGLATESKSFIMKMVNKNNFPKDTKSFPYTGKIAHRQVGIVKGTGCRRRWDFIDTHDSLPMNMPYDLCGKYAMVSNRYHKWVDLSKYGDKVEKLAASPVKGDAVLEKLDCVSKNVYKLIHYPVCGGEGKVIAYCDKSGNSVNPDKYSCRR